MRPADAARLLVLGAIWGSSYLFIELALEGFSPLQIVAARLVIGASVIAALMYSQGLRLPRNRAVWRALAVMAVVSNVVPFLLITWGQQSVSSHLAAILNSTTPLFTALLASLFLAGESIGPLRALGIALGFVGAAAIVGFGSGGGSPTGALAVVVAAASYGCGFVFARRALTPHGLPAMSLSAGQLVTASLIALPLLPLDPGSATEPRVTLLATLGVIELGAVGTGLAYFLYYRLVSEVGATTASFVTYLIPLFGVVLGWLFLDEQIGWHTLLGGVLVVGGIALAERGSVAHRRPPREPAAPERARELVG